MRDIQYPDHEKDFTHEKRTTDLTGLPIPNATFGQFIRKARLEQTTYLTHPVSVVFIV